MTSATTLATLACIGLAPSLHAADATALIHDRDGNDLGAVLVEDMPSGIALATLALTNLPGGIHGVHLHETGDCESDDFSSAGGHISGDRAHGVAVEGGPHPGDMPNLTVKGNGVGEVQYFLPFLDVERDLLDEDGAAFIMHDGIDDYASQPSGNAGNRIACGVFTARGD